MKWTKRAVTGLAAAAEMPERWCDTGVAAARALDFTARKLAVCPRRALALDQFAARPGFELRGEKKQLLSAWSAPCGNI